MAQKTWWKSGNMASLTQLLKQLREPGGCPWDQKQTLASLCSYTIEEVYELIDAVHDQDWQNIKDELGDLLFHIAFYSRIAEENKQFTLTDVVQTITEKMVTRHPHVFSNDKQNDTASVEAWEKQKRKAKNYQSHDSLGIDNISQHLPALLFALKLHKKMSVTPLERQGSKNAVNQVEQNWATMKSHQHGEHSQMEAEMGELLFSIANLAFQSNIDPEIALRKTIAQYKKRLHWIDEQAQLQGAQLTELDEALFLQYWHQSQNKLTRNH